VSAQEDFAPIPKGPVAATPVADEPQRYGDPAAPKAPNSVMLKFGKESFISWQSDNPIAVLALMMMVILIFAAIIIAGIACIPGSSPSVGKIAEIIGQAILTIVGAIIGSSASAKARK